MISTPLYPEGRTPFYSKWSGGILKFYKRSTRAEFLSVNGNTGSAYGTGLAKNLRTRLTLAQVNAGATLLAAVPGYKYRLVDYKVIAVGGNAAVGTSVDLTATQSASPALLVVAAQAGLTRSTVVRDGDATGAVLADGASYVQNDVNTAITVAAVGTFTTATHFDFVLTYALEV